MNNCNNCSNRVFDERWGMYMCTTYKHNTKDADRYIDCSSHNKKGEDTNG